ncbi:MAG: trypsin-like peptidase domain-containing protein [Planctomycetes bacterium]|nr:trypsin-like peptidase domain-containing protein [Planctomycetota bacterium]
MSLHRNRTTPAPSSAPSSRRSRAGSMRTGLGVTGALLGLALAGTAHLDREVDVAQGVSRAFEEVSERIAPSVVRIESARRLDVGVRPLGEGSGFVLDEAGLIVTNAHVVDGADAIRVQLLDGRALDADLVGKDTESDLAVLCVEADGLVAAPLRLDEPARVGEWVIAVGNPLGLGHSVSAGIVSGRGRTANITTYEDFIQTDAAINPGNSGGPLVDLQGRIVGVNTAVADIRMGGQGIGFAIPASMVSEVTAQLARWGEVRRGYVGVNLRELRESELGGLDYSGPSRVAVRSVVRGGPAEAAGLEPGDLVTRVNDRPVTTVQSLMAVIASYAPGTEVQLEVRRDRSEKAVAVKLGERPRPK